MYINYEFKARCNDLGLLETKLQQYTPLFIGTDHQVDTYFNVPNGRLKLREGNIENSLIHYNRTDAAGAKQSDVSLYPHQPDKNLKSLLSKALGVKTVVEKRRKIYFIDNVPRYGNSILRKVRLGQGAFRVLITEAYSRRCSITGEKTLHVLEAAHIKPYSQSGPHFISNGLLLRSDLHKLFDSGYITITKEYKVEISKRIKEEFENGKEYYQYHGKVLNFLPTRNIDEPYERYIEWHNSQFRG